MIYSWFLCCEPRAAILEHGLETQQIRGIVNQPMYRFFLFQHLPALFAKLASNKKLASAMQMTSPENVSTSKIQHVKPCGHSS